MSTFNLLLLRLSSTVHLSPVELTNTRKKDAAHIYSLSSAPYFIGLTWIVLKQLSHCLLQVFVILVGVLLQIDGLVGISTPDQQSATVGTRPAIPVVTIFKVFLPIGCQMPWHCLRRK